jgi:hypothetical protein
MSTNRATIRPLGFAVSRHRDVRATLLTAALVAASWGTAAGQNAAGQAPGAATRPSPPTTSAPAAAPASAPSAPEPIDRQPYRIELHLSLDPSARIDHARRAALLKQWQALVHRFVGPPWMVTVASQPTPLANGNLETLEAAAFSKFDPAFDKIWLVRVSAGTGSSGLIFTGREYDAATRSLGPYQQHKAAVLADAPRALLQFTYELFNPTALITGQEGGRALLLVRGAAIPPAGELGRVVTKGTVFVPLRLVNVKDNVIVIRRILYTYLQVESMDGSLARCAIVTALRDPLTQRVSRPNTLAALGLKTGNSVSRLRFLTRPDLAPAAGYTLTARSVPDGLPHEIGITDRAGRIILKPGIAKGLVILRLVAGNAEPMTEFPAMPGENSEERVVPFDPKPLTVSYQVQLDAIRDEVVDLVALRARLEKRMEARLQGEDLAGVEEGLKEYALLAPRELFAEQLAKLKEQAARQHAEAKTPVLTKNIQAQFNELQALIDRYLDNEAFTTYTEALERKRAEQASAAKSRAKDAPRRQAAAATPPPAPAPAEPPIGGVKEAPQTRPAGPAVRPKAKALAKPGDAPF